MNWLSTTAAAGADWGNVPGWIAVGVSVIGTAIAVTISWKAKNASERSAAASEQSATNGARSAAAAEKSAENGKRSADTAVAALKFQQQAAQPKVKLVIRPAARGILRLTNDGDAPADGIALHPGDVSRIDWVDEPLGSTLAPKASCDFMVRTPADAPSSLRFTWTGRTEPTHVSMP